MTLSLYTIAISTTFSWKPAPRTFICGSILIFDLTEVGLAKFRDTSVSVESIVRWWAVSVPSQRSFCNYLGVVGAASSTLRDVRSNCEYAFVVGLVGVSKIYFSRSEVRIW